MLREPDLTPLPKTLDWSCVSLKRGEKISGVLIGKPRKFMCHTLKTGASKPCLAYATSGKLACWCAERVTSARPIVYVPIRQRDKEQVVVRMSAVQGYRVESFPLGSLVEFERPDRAKRPTVAKRLGGPSVTQQWVLDLQMQPGVDILEYLCHLWQLHALTKFCGFTPHRSIAAASKVDLSEPDYLPRFSYVEKLQGEDATSGEGV